MRDRGNTGEPRGHIDGGSTASGGTEKRRPGEREGEEKFKEEAAEEGKVGESDWSRSLAVHTWSRPTLTMCSL